MIHFDLDAIQRNGYWEAVGARNGEDIDREFDPAESAEAHEPTITVDPWTAEVPDPWTQGVVLDEAPF